MKNKFLSKRDLLMIIIGGILFSGVTVFAVDTIASSMVTYDNTTSHATTTNVQSAIDDLYNGVFNIVSATGSGFSMITHVPAGLSSECLPAGSSECMYRYQGIEDTSHSVNNYICFGTKDKDTCVNDKNTYFYRIIGVNNSGQLKLIKWEFIGGSKWNSSWPETWDNCDIYKGINGDLFYNNTTFVPTNDNGVNWQSKIVKSDWHMFSGSDSITVEGELSAPTVNNYIGLVYYTDFQNSGSGSWVWLASRNNTTTYSREWTMATGISNPYRADWSGYYGRNDSYGYSFGIRPVFFLSSNETIASGTGSKTDPYIIG